ncbi:hypothetical protein GOBAR_DD05934 [Gossypium barbadense]|nr:hypothetical protein GOBAR_DD05934 [Gossypium barbadense]
MTRLESDMEGQKNTPFRQWLGIMKSWQWAQNFDEGFRYGHMTTNLVEGANSVLMKTQHLPISSIFSATFYRLATLMLRMRQQQVNQIEAGHVFFKDVRDSIVVNHRTARSMNVELVLKSHSMLNNLSMRCTPSSACCVSGRISSLSCLTVYMGGASTTFEFVLYKGLRRNPKGHLQLSRINNEMDIKEKSDRKLCGVCRLASHNRSKCLH